MRAVDCCETCPAQRDASVEVDAATVAAAATEEGAATEKASATEEEAATEAAAQAEAAAETEGQRSQASSKAMAYLGCHRWSQLGRSFPISRVLHLTSSDARTNRDSATLLQQRRHWA